MKRWCVVIGWVVLVLLLGSKAGLTAAYAEERSKKAVSSQAKKQQAKEQAKQQAREQQAREQQAREEQAREQRAREQQAREQQAREEQAREQQAREQQAREEQAREQQAREEQAREQQAKERDTKGVPTGENSWVELEVRGWAPSLRGTIQSSATNMLGTDLKLGDTLGMDTSRQFVWPKATLHFAKNHRIWASYLDMQYSGDKTLTQTITFGGSSFGVTTSVHSELNFKEIAGGYQYDWLKFSKFASNLNLQVHYLDLNAKLRSNAVGTVTESIKVPIPTIGGGVQVWPVDWLKLHGDFNIVKLGIAGYKGEMIDSQAALTVSPWEWLGASVGYRYYRLIARDTKTNDRADWLQHGPYVSVMVRF